MVLRILRRFRGTRKSLYAGAGLCILYIIYSLVTSRGSKEEKVSNNEQHMASEELLRSLHRLPLDQFEDAKTNGTSISGLDPTAGIPPGLLPSVPGVSMLSSPSKPLPDLSKTLMDMYQRLTKTSAQCEKFKVNDGVESRVYILSQHNLTYCKVPNAGSNYWDKIFSFLQKSPQELAGLGVKTPFQISKYDIRYTELFKIPAKHWKSDSDRTEINKYVKMLFVMHPLERLWHGYMEKFFLIDYWTSLALEMETEGVAEKCPKSVTFLEFIEFVLPNFNPNWAPVTELCNPCTYQPQIIGHVETMREDIYYTLKQARLDWIFMDQDRVAVDESKMMDSIVYNFQIHDKHWTNFYEKCFSHKDLANRLWESFIKLGYLTKTAKMPDTLPAYNQTTVLTELKRQYKGHSMDAISRRTQQLKVMKRDYESLPKGLMAKILAKYAMDFQLFGYSTELPSD